MEKSCLFICAGEYPDNHAPAIRHTLFARGLVKLGWELEIWLLTPQPWSHLPVSRSHGLSFKTLNTVTGNQRWRRAIAKLTVIVKLPRLIYLHAKKCGGDGNSVIVCYCTEIVFLIPVLLSAKIFHLPVLHERTEYPHVVSKSTIVGKLALHFYLKYVLPMFDRLLVINDSLGRHLSAYNDRSDKLLTVVDMKEFVGVEKAGIPSPYIAYCGTMYGSKDGIDMLVRAFSIVAKEFSEWKLVLVGDNSKKAELSALTDLIDRLGLSERVIFTGRLARRKVPVVLTSASILALAKPSNEQNAGNFPSKIGEYLATGVPVVVTNVGEIPKFIEDGVNGYLCEPDVDSFAARLRYVIQNREEAVRVGENGRKLAARSFSYESQSSLLSQYMLGALGAR